MIITKTPYRISFFGGGSDYPEWYKKYGGMVLSTTIDKYIYISCRYLPKFFKHKYRIVWSKIENVRDINQIQHRAVKKLLEHLKVKQGLEIHYDGDLPARSGMGSSSCFAVGLSKALYKIKGQELSKQQLAKKTIEFEQKIMKEIVGSQDQTIASYGGFNKIIFNKNNNFNKGILLTAAGSFWWGFIGVIYFKYISFVGHIEVVIHRCLWTTNAYKSTRNCNCSRT